MNIEQRVQEYPSALEVNLERTAVSVEIPERYRILMVVTEGHYGLSRQTEDLLKELNHPYVNWEYCLKTLKTISIGDFYTFNNHKDGIQAIQAIYDIYIEILRSCPNENIKETAGRYLFEYLHTVLTKGGEHKTRNLLFLNNAFEILYSIAVEQDGIFKKNSGGIKVLLNNIIEEQAAITTPYLKKLIHEIFRQTYKFWLSQPDPYEWKIGDRELTVDEKEEIRKIIYPLTHEYINSLLERIDAIGKTEYPDIFRSISAYLELPDHSRIVDGYFIAADKIERMERFRDRSQIIKLNFLYNMMNIKALSDVYMNILLEINRCLGRVFKEIDPNKMDSFIGSFFAMLQGGPSYKEQKGPIIDCITTVGREVFNQNNHRLANTFIDELINFGFQYPEIKGSTTEWQVIVNPAHVMNIRSWLTIISMKPRWTKRLLSALIINLKLGGVFVKDTDLIQKDISNLLNADIGPAYNLVKQLLRMFPVFFTEIGAEGELRAISTNVDEMSHRNDRLINFLRKQSHVESNSLLVNFIEEIFRFWQTGVKEGLKAYLPDEVYEWVKNSGEYFDGMHRIFKWVIPVVNGNPEGLLTWEKDEIQKKLKKIRGITEQDREKASLMIRFYQLLYKKYNARHVDLLKDLGSSGIFPLVKINKLKRHLARGDHYNALVIVIDFLSLLKEKILSPRKTEFYENIYYKRHIAAGIPSMYGTYKEEKFEALGLSFRLESLATVLLESLAGSLNLKFITKSTLIMIEKYLWLYLEALELDGISVESLSEKLRYITSALKIRQFSIDQYVDIFKFISKGIQDIIHDYYIDVHGVNLPTIIRQIAEKGIKREWFGNGYNIEEVIYQQSENLLRSLVSSGFGLQVLDNLINTIRRNLDAELERFKDNKEILNIVMRYIPELAISPINKRDKNTDNPILIGNKGYFLKVLSSFEFPVPPGFIITTEVFRGYDAVVGYKYIFKDLSHRIYNELLRLEKITGLKYGNPANPLLLSVRSGATISLPGMMSSFLNVGINEKIAEGLSKQNKFAWAAWDSYRRFIQTWGMFQGMDRDLFDMIIEGFKERHDVTRKIQFSPAQMREIALAYKKILIENGIELPDNPYKQLEQAILQVFASWHSERARLYRQQMNVSDDWGTAVIVQKMVFGNLDNNSGSGVIFTRDPKGQSSQVSLYGDFIFGVQGDDIVSGLVETYPVSEKQRIMEHRESPISLENDFPEIYKELLAISEKLVYEKGFNHQEIEFTFENPTKSGLYILQTRDMAQRVKKVVKKFKPTEELQRALIGTGIGIAGGALSGRAVYNKDDIERFRQDDPDTPLILIRPDTVPDDVGIMLKVDGLLTSRGGSTSHAAVTVPQLNKVGVVGFTKLKVYEEEGYSVVDRVVIRSGDFISIDGFSGSVYKGSHEIIQD